MSSLAAAIVGTGEDDLEKPWLAGIAYPHGTAYREAEGVDLVACADIVPANAEAYAAKCGIDEANVYADYREMLHEVEPDIVSVCVPPSLHADLVVGCARTGVPRAIHCEKPMADTWGRSRRMAQECWRRGIELTINHQQRFGTPWRRAKELLDDGEIGELRRIETARDNIYDSGTHNVDLCNYFVDERSIEWVLGNVDYREENLTYGAHNENQALALWKYENGVHGMASMGDGADLLGSESSIHRLIGTEGAIEVGRGDAFVRIRRAGDAEWESVDANGEGLYGFDEGVHDYGHVYFDRAIQDVVDSVAEGYESTLSARNALNATELIFGAYESARRRGRVEFPLEIDDNPLAAMVDSDDLNPE